MYDLLRGAGAGAAIRPLHAGHTARRAFRVMPVERIVILSCLYSNVPDTVSVPLITFRRIPANEGECSTDSLGI